LEVAEDPGETVRAALLVVAVAVIIIVLPLLANLPGTDAVELRDRLVTRLGVPAQAAEWLVLAFGALIPLFWLAQAGVVGGLARLIGTPPRYGALLRTTGYASVFSLIGILPLPLADPIGGILGMAAYLIAIRTALGVGPRRAVGLGCGSLLLTGALVIGLVVLALLVVTPGGR
jgi:hypothetical protein